MMTADTDNVVTIKSLIIRAWRERWPDKQFSIYLKKILDSSRNHAYTLADLLLQQALVGTTPNTLLMSYLKHVTASHVVPLSSVIEGIIKFDDISRPECLLSVMEMSQDVISCIRHSSCSENSLVLAKSLLQLVIWLLHCVHQCLVKLSENKSLQKEYSSIISKGSDCVVMCTEKDASKVLLYIAKKDSLDLSQEQEQSETNIRGTLSQSLPWLSGPIREQIEQALKALVRVKDLSFPQPSLLESEFIPSVICSVVAFEAILNPLGEIRPFVDQLLMLEQLQNTSRVDFYYELFRACCVGLIDCADEPEELKWSAFTFLKLPVVLSRVFQLSPGRCNSEDLEQGLNKLLNYTNLLDLAEVKCNCELLKQVLNELSEKYSLLTLVQCRKLQTRRANESRKVKPMEQTGHQANASLILRAEPTVNSLLKTLDADYSKNQDALLGVLCHMLSGKSFELILVAAATTHKLQNFAVKLVKFNEFAKQTPGEGGKAAYTRALLFDISFLMLCHMTQSYGTELVVSDPESRESFFAQWATKFLTETGISKQVEEMSPCDPTKLDSLLGQLNVGGELKTSLTRWHEVCTNLPFAMLEVLSAAEHGVISDVSLKEILDNLKSRLCCLPVVACGWLCSYMNSVGDSRWKIPQNMIRQLKTPIQIEAAQSNTYYTERSQLMGVVLKRMLESMLPETSQNLPATDIKQHVLYDDLSNTFKHIFKKNWIDLKSTRTLENLLNVGGPDWFCDHLVKEMLRCCRLEDLSQGLSLVIAILYIDLETLVISLLRYVVPRLMKQPLKSLCLVDPKGRCVAQLCVAGIIAVHMHKKSERELHHRLKRGRKRSRTEYEMDNIQDIEQPSKVKKTQQPTEELTLHSEGFNMDLMSAGADMENTPKYDTKDSFNHAIASLFNLFSLIAQDTSTNHVTNFICRFLQETMNSGPENSRFIMQFLLGNYSMVSQLCQKIPEMFSPELVLSLCDASKQNGRLAAAKILRNLEKLKPERSCKD